MIRFVFGDTATIVAGGVIEMTYSLHRTGVKEFTFGQSAFRREPCTPGSERQMDRRFEEKSLGPSDTKSCGSDQVGVESGWQMGILPHNR
jgi:hypothetical protein